MDKKNEHSVPPSPPDYIVEKVFHSEKRQDNSNRFFDRINRIWIGDFQKFSKPNSKNRELAFLESRKMLELFVQF